MSPSRLGCPFPSIEEKYRPAFWALSELYPEMVYGMQRLGNYFLNLCTEYVHKCVRI